MVARCCVWCCVFVLCLCLVSCGVVGGTRRGSWAWPVARSRRRMVGWMLEGTSETRHCPLSCVTSPGDRGWGRFDLANRCIGTYRVHQVCIWGSAYFQQVSYRAPSQAPGEPHGQRAGLR